MNRRRCLVLALLLGGCASGPPVPDWSMTAVSSMAAATSAYLAGNDKLEAREFTRARREIASTGRIALVARAELIRCATRVASLVFDDCPGFDKLRDAAEVPERVYADFLAGRLKPHEVALLPEQHRAAMSVGMDAGAAEVAKISDPLARLVAAGVLFRSGRASPAVLAVAAQAASEQGWSRPLLAWLGVQALRAEKIGDTDAAQRLRRRIELVRES